MTIGIFVKNIARSAEKCFTPVMVREKRLNTWLSILMALLFLGASNHCIIEDFFVSFSGNILGSEINNLHSGDLGHSSPYEQEESPKSHEHGQTHLIMVLNLDKAHLSCWVLLGMFFILCPMVIYSLGFVVVLSCREISTFLKITGNFHVNKSLIFSFNRNPQAPPS